MDGLGRGTGNLNGGTGHPSLMARADRGLRRHWMFATLLVLGAALRAVVSAAYHPALIFSDSVRYLQYAQSFADGRWSVDELRQSGYSVLLIPVMLLHDMWIIPLAQHLVGLATALLVYAVLIHFRIRTWLAAVATIPVLFDPLQLVLEQYVLTDTWTVFLLVAALVILVWPRGSQGEESQGEESQGGESQGEEARDREGRDGESQGREGRSGKSQGGESQGEEARDREGRDGESQGREGRSGKSQGGESRDGESRDEQRGGSLGWRLAAACGLLLGLAVTFRDEELIMIVPAALYLAVAVRPWRRLAKRLALLIGCFLIPVAGYLGWFDASHGEWSFTTFSGAFLYGRVADFASCQGLTLPGYERPLCPAQPPAARDADFYTWDPRSPQWTFRPPAGMSRDAVVRDFSLRILRHQPLAYAEAVGRDFSYGFSPVRGAGPEHYPSAYLQFHTYIRPDRQAYASIGALGYQPPALRAGPAAFLTGYGRWFYVPGPVFAAGLALALAGLIAAAGRRGRPRTTRDACLLFTASAVLVLVPPAVFATFDWRYQLPQLTLIPVAAVLGAALLGGRRLIEIRPSTGGTARRARPASADSGLRSPDAR